MLHLPSQHHLCILQGLVVEQPVQLCPLRRGVAVLVLLPLAYVLGNAIGIYGIWWSFFISEIVTVAFALLYLAGTEKKELDCISSAL